jgi:predicted DNA-binding ribbon-helix-helix protein
MMKIFTTQLNGYFNRISEKEELNIEDGARILAQGLIGDGKLFIHGFQEMEAIAIEATKGADALNAELLLSNGNLENITSVDRVLVCSRYAHDQETIELAKAIAEKNIPFVTLGALDPKQEGETAADYSDVHIDTKLLKPLIPGDDGERFGFPSTMVGLYAYYAVLFTIKEMMEEYE